MRKCPYLKCIQSKYAQIIRIWTARYTTRQKLTQQRSFIHIWWHYNSTHYKTIWIKFSYCDWWQLYRLVEESLVDSTLPSRLPNRFCFLSKDLPPQHLHFIDSYPHHGNGICHLQHISHTNVIHYLLKTKYRENVFLRTTRTVYTSPGQSNANSMLLVLSYFSSMPEQRQNARFQISYTRKATPSWAQRRHFKWHTPHSAPSYWLRDQRNEM